MGATALLATQPPPAGRTVAIVSNVGGAGVLAADACTDLGLTVHHPRGETRQLLSALIPDGGSVSGPVDTVATVSADDFRQALEVLAADEEVHAIIALVLRTGATGDLLSAIEDADLGVPLAVVVLNQPEAVRTLDTRRGKVPAYAYPEAAARALARAARYAQWRARAARRGAGLRRRGRRAGPRARARLPRRPARRRLAAASRGRRAARALRAIAGARRRRRGPVTTWWPSGSPTTRCSDRW